MDEDEQRIAKYISNLGNESNREVSLTMSYDAYKQIFVEIEALKLRIHVLEALYLRDGVEKV